MTAADISNVTGNAPDDVKCYLNPPSAFFLRRGPSTFGQFGVGIIQRLTLKEVSIVSKAEEPLRKEGRVVCELTTEEDMVNGGGTMHGACGAFLIDICSSLAVVAFGLTNNDPNVLNTVSQSLNIVYHSPAVVGDKLRIVNTTLTLGSRAISARTEIWNDTHHRLVASGTHVIMQPSKPKPNL